MFCMHDKQSSKKVVFASILRGIAAFMVAFNHIVAIFYNDQENTKKLIHDSAFVYNGSNNNMLFKLMTSFASHTGISWGLLGVSIFFLISGFVIPFSLEKRSFWKFMENRLMRIVPTAAVAVGIAVFALLICSYLIPTNNFKFDIWEYFANILMIRPFTGEQFIDPVMWTLEIEMMFYILIGFASSRFDLKKQSSVIIVSTGFAVLSLCSRLLIGHTSIEVYFLTNLSYWLVFMMFGTCFYNLFKSNWTPRQFCLTFLLNLGIWICAKNYISIPKFSGVFNMLLAISIFGGMYFLNNRLTENKILRFLSDISYPLYISHQIIGYLMLAYMIWFFNFSPVASGLVVFILMIVYAWLLHLFVEIPTQKMSKLI